MYYKKTINKTQNKKLWVFYSKNIGIVKIN